MHIRRLTKINGKEQKNSQRRTTKINKDIVLSLNKLQAKQFQNVSISNKDEWYSFILSSIENIEEEFGERQWSTRLTDYMKHNRYQLETSKFKGEIFYFKFTRQHKSHLAQMQLINEVEQLNN